MIHPLHALSFKDSFTQDLTALLSGDRQGHMIEWEYGAASYKNDPAGGADFWDKVTQYPTYYLDREEQKLIKAVADDVAHLIAPVCNIAEFGPGKSSKIIPLLKSILPSHVTGVDICQTFLTDFHEKISENVPTLIDLKEVDFVNAPPYFQEKTLLLCFGSTFFNTPMLQDGTADFETMINTLRRWKESLTNGGYVLLGQDTNNDPATLNAAYNQPYIKSMTESLWHRAHRELNIYNFDPNGIEYSGEWDKKNKVFKHMIVPKYDQKIHVDGLPYELKKGEAYCPSNSFKLSSGHMHDLISSASMTLIKSWHSPQSRMILHLIKAR